MPNPFNENRPVPGSVEDPFPFSPPSPRVISHQEIGAIISSWKNFINDFLKSRIGFDSYIEDRFIVQSFCKLCGSLIDLNFNKSSLKDYIFHFSLRENLSKSINLNRICERCKCSNGLNKEKKTRDYIERYLTVDQDWSVNISPKDRIDLIQNSGVDSGEIFKKIKGMKYEEFLTTPYWKAITAHVKYRARYRCQICDSRQKLSTHHRNYQIHGQEHLYLDELIALCQVCHNKFHNGSSKRSKQLPKIEKSDQEIKIIFLVFFILLVKFIL